MGRCSGRPVASRRMIATGSPTEKLSFTTHRTKEFRAPRGRIPSPRTSLTTRTPCGSSSVEPAQRGGRSAKGALALLSEQVNTFGPRRDRCTRKMEVPSSATHGIGSRPSVAIVLGMSGRIRTPLRLPQFRPVGLTHRRGSFGRQRRRLGRPVGAPGYGAGSAGVLQDPVEQRDFDSVHSASQR